MYLMENIIRKLVRRFGYDVMSAQKADELTFVNRIPYATEQENQIIEFCKPFTQTTRWSIFSLIRAIKYLVRNAIPGSYVECGVWKGGSVMAMAMTLDLLEKNENIYLFDTFKGMPSGMPVDVDLDGNNEQWYRKESDKYIHGGSGSAWNAVSLGEVRENLKMIPLCRQQFHFIEGMVEVTLPNLAPEVISLLRLDTDFYSSTKCELELLFPRLSKGGVLIVDDYGHFLGARKAVDEYFDAHDIRMLMHRIDYTAILGIKN